MGNLNKWEGEFSKEEMEVAHKKSTDISNAESSLKESGKKLVGIAEEKIPKVKELSQEKDKKSLGEKFLDTIEGNSDERKSEEEAAEVETPEEEIESA